MANMLMFETNKYAIKIDNFEGPLDLLCHLIDKNKMDIYDIKINEIADQYIEYLNQMEEMNLDIASEFININLFKIQEFTSKTRRSRRRAYRRRTYTKNYRV